jgi:cytidine deaminase
MTKQTVSPRACARLVADARAVARSAHAPYSDFRVGAAVLTEKGVFRGSNVENASFGLTLCAERSALASAVSAGARRIRAVCVSCIDARRGAAPGELMPCGACRQWFVELASDAEIIIDGLDRSFTVEELMSSPFALKSRR